METHLNLLWSCAGTAQLKLVGKVVLGVVLPVSLLAIALAATFAYLFFKYKRRYAVSFSPLLKKFESRALLLIAPEGRRPPRLVWACAAAPLKCLTLYVKRNLGFAELENVSQSQQANSQRPQLRPQTLAPKWPPCKTNLAVW